MEHASIAEQLNQVVGGIENHLDDAGEAGERTVKKMLSTTRRATAQALEVTKDKFADGQELMRTGYKKSLDLFRQYPVESAVVCLGAGFLVGKVFQSRK